MTFTALSISKYSEKHLFTAPYCRVFLDRLTSIKPLSFFTLGFDMRYLSVTFSILFTLIVFITSGPVLAEDFQTPESAVNTYITAVKTGSGKHITMAFAASASIQYYDDKGTMNNYSRDAFAKLVDTGNQWNATIEITDIKKTKNAANATVDFTWGEQGQKGYVDYLNLIYDGKRWHITDKVAQYVER
jgi:hypothetical protein